MAEAFGFRTALMALCMRASSRTDHKSSTVLFQNSAIIVEKPRLFEPKKQVAIRHKMLFLVFPLLMFSVAKQRVVRAGLVEELAL